MKKLTETIHLTFFPSLSLYLLPLNAYLNYIYLALNTACSHTLLQLSKRQSVYQRTFLSRLSGSLTSFLWSIKTLVFSFISPFILDHIKFMLFSHLSYLLIYTKVHKNWKENKRNGMSMTSNVENVRVAFMPQPWRESSSFNSLHSFNYDPYAGICTQLLYIYRPYF